MLVNPTKAVDTSLLAKVHAKANYAYVKPMLFANFSSF